MAVEVSKHGQRTEIIQRAEFASGTIGRQALLLSMVLAAVCIAVLVMGVMLWNQQASGALPDAELWIGAVFFGGGIAALAAAALREMSNALPRQITILPNTIAVQFATPLPASFAVARDEGGGPTAELHRRVHKNFGVNEGSSGGYVSFKSIKTYVQVGTRFIGPMDQDDAKALVAAMNAAMKAAMRSPSPGQRFTDIVVHRAHQFSLGIDTRTDAYYLSTLVTKDGQHHLAAYEAYFRIDPDEFQRFRDDPSSASEFVTTCRRNGHRDRLIP